MPNYTKEQLWGLYKNLPEELQKATFSDEVAQNIQEICNNNGITDDDLISEIAKNIGYVFLGLLPPNEFSYILEKELKIEKDRAEQIASEITRFVFLPVRPNLEALYKMEIKPSIKPGADITALRETPAPTKKKPKRKDFYRETLE